MTIIKLIENEEYTYKQLCELKNEPCVTGNSKISQLQRWSNYEVFEKNGTKYKYIRARTADEIQSYDWDIFMKKANDRLGNDRNFKFKVAPLNYNQGGVYKITSGNKIYIGQTNNFRKRFLSHLNCDSSSFRNTYEMLQKDDGYFEIIEIENDLKKRLERETCWIKYFSTICELQCINRRLPASLKLKTKKAVNPQFKIIINVNDLEKTIKLLNQNDIKFEMRN